MPLGTYLSCCLFHNLQSSCAWFSIDTETYGLDESICWLGSFARLFQVMVHRPEIQEDMQKAHLTTIITGICKKPNSARLTFLQTWSPLLVVLLQSFQLAVLDSMVLDKDDWFRIVNPPFTSSLC